MQQQRPRDAQRQEEADHAGVADIATGRTTVGGTPHDGIDAALDEAVEDEAGRRQQADAGGTRQQGTPRDALAFGGGHEHADHGAEDGQQHDAWLGENVILACDTGQRLLAGGR